MNWLNFVKLMDVKRMIKHLDKGLKQNTGRWLVCTLLRCIALNNSNTKNIMIEGFYAVRFMNL